MSTGPLPPVPDLIPIAALLSKPIVRECAPSAEVMGEQRSRRTATQPSVELIDSVAQSRGSSAAPHQAPQSRKARSERHRKSDRRREHRKQPARTRSASCKQSNNNNNNNTSATINLINKSREPSPERPANPRVNPIFVWVRQEDNRIVDVKCEDYDKRNRILLTKTAQGWRAIPRTETLVPNTIKDDKHHHHGHHHHHHKNRKSRKSNKVRRKSTAVQVDSDFQDLNECDEEEVVVVPSSPTWSSPVNVESHLPSHKIHVPKKCPSPSSITDSVNSGVDESAHSQTEEEKCSDDKMCDVSPLDNLLAVAEFEFNQHMQSGEWDDNKSNDDDDGSGVGGGGGGENCGGDNDAEQNDDDDDAEDDDEDENQKNFMENIEQLNNLIDSCTKSEMKTSPNKEECDYNEDDDNNLAMDDILSRLEQSLRSPECAEITQELNDCTQNYHHIENNNDENVANVGDVIGEDEQQMEQDGKEEQQETPSDDNYKLDIKENDDYFITSDINENNYKSVPDEDLNRFFEADKETKNDENLIINDELNDENKKGENGKIVESSPALTIMQPEDLSIKSKNCDSVSCDEPEQPTDLTLPKNNKNTSSSPARSITPRPPSQNSEAIQSPQPSGIPAVPPSPDIVSPSANSKINSKLFIDTLLSYKQPIITNHSEITIIKQKEPLDLGKSRKSASPTVTCSEEVKNSSDLEPPAKKFKSNNNNNVSLKNLLGSEENKIKESGNNKEKSPVTMPETPRLLELLKTDTCEPDPVTQLRQILYDSTLNIPDPMLVPKERLSLIISHPGKEIPRLLKQRPELRLPEALAFPHLLQDPDILVITLQQLETIILKQNQSLKDLKPTVETTPAAAAPSQPPARKPTPPAEKPTHHHKKEKSIEQLLAPVKENYLTTSHHSKSKSNKHHEDHMAKMLQETMGGHHQPQQLANDIDAATAAAFNQMIWMPYFDQLQAMTFANGGGMPNTDMMKMLSSGALPMYPSSGQLPDLSRLPPAASRFPQPPVNFPNALQPPSPAQMNYNALELSMWQEAMMQANMLRPKMPFDGITQKQNTFRDYLDKFNLGKQPSVNKLPNMINNNNSKPTNNNLFPPHHPAAVAAANFPFPNGFPSNNNNPSSKQNMAMPHFNPALFNQKNLFNQQHQQQQQKTQSHSYLSKHQQKMDQKMNFANFYHAKMEENFTKHKPGNNAEYKTNNNNGSSSSNSKLTCKPFANVGGFKHQEHQGIREKPNNNNNGDFTKHHHHHTQPIDLSGSTAPPPPTSSKLKVKQHLIDPTNNNNASSAAKLLKQQHHHHHHQEDVPEVGSTTASVEEMQDAHKHLWHPLFGNQKGYHSPWNWTTVTATGE